MRKEFDNYDTPPALALAGARWCAANLGLSPEGAEASGKPPKILDPMAGGGPWVRAARAVWPESWIAGIDIRPEAEQAIRAGGASWVGIRDVFSVPPETFAPVDLVITNPSFIEADRLLRHLWKGLRDGAHVAFLLNVTFIGSDERWDPAGGLFTFALPRYMLPIVPRPSFLTIDGHDTSPKFEAGFFVWTKGRSLDEAGGPRGACAIPGPLHWDKPKRERRKRTAAA